MTRAPQASRLVAPEPALIHYGPMHWKLATTVGKPLVQALMPRVTQEMVEKLRGTQLDQELDQVVEAAWRSAAAVLTQEATAETGPPHLDELGILLGRALACDGVAQALVASLFDPRTPFQWERYPEAGAILNDADPASTGADPRRCWELFLGGLAEAVVEAGQARGLFELASLAHLRALRQDVGEILHRLEPTPVRHREPPAYWATMAELRRRTPRLEGRDGELDALRSFATGPPGYCWRVGDAWAGKSALLAELTASPGPEVDCVAYFLARRQGDADSQRFLSVVSDQLSWLIDPDILSPQASADAFRDLWAQAVERAHGRDRHLLLVVDGLDEDLSAVKGLPSVASYLPQVVKSRGHVLVSSRPYPAIPVDVDVSHPLRGLKKVPLSPSPRATRLKALAEQELVLVLQNDLGHHPLEEGAADVLCLLAAAEGPLRIEDLATLTNRKPEVIERLGRQVIARQLQVVATDGDEAFVFGHDTLREACVDEFTKYGRLDAARDRLRAWAQNWATKGWPIEESPPYLVSSYPRMLARVVPQRLGELIEDLAFLEAAVARAGVNSTLALLSSQARWHGTPAGDAIRLLGRQAHLLRRAQISIIRRAGFVTQQIALEALADGASNVVARAASRLGVLPCPQLIPRWTLRSGEPALTGEFSTGRHLSCVALSADGTRAVSAGEDGLQMWDLEAHSAVGEPLGHRRVISVAMSADGTRAMSAGEYGLQVWDLEAHNAVGEPLGHRRVISVAMSADGTRALSAGEDGLQVWDLEAHIAVGEPFGHRRVINVAMSADGTRALSAGEYALRVWDLEAHSAVGTPLGRRRVVSVALSADGTRALSAGEGGTLRVWDLESHTFVGEPLSRHDVPLISAAFSADGTWAVSGGVDGTLRVWDLEVRTPVGDPLAGHHSMIWSVALSADGTRAVSGGEDGTVWLWDHLKRRRRLRTLLGHYPWRALRSVALSADGTTAVTAGEGGILSVWDLESLTFVGEPDAGHPGVTSVALSADGTMAVTAGDSTLRVWDLEALSPVGEPLSGHLGRVICVALSADGTRAVSGGEDGSLRAWDLESHTFVGEPLRGHLGRVNTVALSADGTWAVSGGEDGSLRAWDLQGRDQTACALLPFQVTSVATSSWPTEQVQLFAADVHGTLTAWDVRLGPRDCPRP